MEKEELLRKIHWLEDVLQKIFATISCPIIEKGGKEYGDDESSIDFIKIRIEDCIE